MNKNRRLLITLLICFVLILSVASSIMAQDLTTCRYDERTCEPPPVCSELEPEGNCEDEPEITAPTMNEDEEPEAPLTISTEDTKGQ